MAVPVTPYVDGKRIVVTSTLAYIGKAELIRRDGRVALRAGSVHITGDATVFADVDGDAFLARYLQQELEKYPPARALVEAPDYRRALSWYFGRAIIVIEPRTTYEAFPPGDRCTITLIDIDGYPAILGVPASLQPRLERAHAGDAMAMPLRDGCVSVLIHEESEDLTALRHMTLRGEVKDATFHVTRRSGTLSDDPARTIDYRERERRARSIMRDWPTLRSPLRPWEKMPWLEG